MLFVIDFSLRFGLNYLEDFLLIDAFSFLSSTMILPHLFSLKIIFGVFRPIMRYFDLFFLFDFSLGAVGGLFGCGFFVSVILVQFDVLMCSL